MVFSIHLVFVILKLSPSRRKLFHGGGGSGGVVGVVSKNVGEKSTTKSKKNTG